MGADLPSGTVTFLFTDIEGSTRLLHELGAGAYADALAEHRRVIREACSAEGGVEVDTQGDAFFFAFPTAPGALAAASAFTERLATGPIQVRVGLHTGRPLLTEEGYVGDDVHFGARVAASAHGGQVILSPTTAELIEIELTELGEHRLKDIAEAVPIYQLGNVRFPPLKTISNTNLPRPASSFVGREREVEEALSLLREDARLLTLTGPGGSGKTRLAIEAAAELVPEYKAGVFWVGLASLRDPALVSEAVAQTLGAKDGLAEHIAERELLLLLDNFEQVVEAAPTLSSLLTACPNLRLLVTSRELLRVQGEVEYPVPPLAEAEAVELFCTRSRLSPSESIGELCRRLDSLPLAVELAAARTSALSPTQILERLAQRLDLFKGGRDADSRQQTLRATIEWSYDLLGADEQRLFARLAVFRGGCTLETAEEVCDADLDTLQALVEKSLLRFTSERYWMLETIREFAGERLEELRERETLRRRHAESFVALAEEAHPHFTGNPEEWSGRLGEEHDNFRAALDRLGASDATQASLQLAGALWKFWYQRGDVAEGRRRLEAALSADPSLTAPRARALNGATALALQAGDTATARVWAEEALTLHRDLADPWGIVNSRFLLGNVLATERQWVLAQGIFEECRQAFRALGDDHYTLLATRALGWMCFELGDIQRYRTLNEEILPQARATGNKRMEARALNVLADFVREEGRVRDALSMSRDALQIDLTIGEFSAISLDLSSIAITFAATGRARAAVKLAACVQALHAEKGAALSYLAEDIDKTITTARAELNDAVFDEAWEQGCVLTLDDAIALALDHRR